MLPPAGRGRPRAGAEARACGVAPAGRARRRGALFRRRSASARLPRGDAAAGPRAEAARVGTRGWRLRPAPFKCGDAQESWCDEQGQWQAPWQGRVGGARERGGPRGWARAPRDPSAGSEAGSPRSQGARPSRRLGAPAVPARPAPPGVGGSRRRPGPDRPPLWVPGGGG